MNKFLVVLLLCGICSAAEVASYQGHKVVRVNAESDSDLQTLQNLVDSASFQDIWSRESTLGLGANDIRVDDALLKAIDNSGLTYKIFIEDLESLIVAEKENYQASKVAADWFAAYHRYDEIVDYLKTLANSHSNIATFIPSIGTSVQGRDLPAIRINATNKGVNTQTIYFQGGQHAREWIGPATVMYVTEQLLTQYGNNQVVTRLLDNVEFVIVPLCNPDGYEYAWTNDRLWRKNRRRNSDGSYGVDMNRNWDDHWGGAGASGTPSSDTYRGTAAFSEPETKALSNFIDSLPNVIAAIDFHSYSQLILRPYGWTTKNCPDEKSLAMLGEGVKFEIERTHGKDYTNERSIDLYITTGSASDWFYQEGIWAAYTIELRDTGAYGFVLPANQIVPTGQEIWNSMLYFCETAYDTYPY